MKILVMGLPGAGKTWLSERLQKNLNCAWYNADSIRTQANDWDFSIDGRVRQSKRMKTLADFEKNHSRIVICDFVCPTYYTRKMFEADITIWIDTINVSSFEDTNALFERPEKVDFQITKHLSDKEIKDLSKQILRLIGDQHITI